MGVGGGGGDEIQKKNITECVFLCASMHVWEKERDRNGEKKTENGNKNSTITLTSTSSGNFCHALSHSVTDKAVHTMLYTVNKMYT